MDAPPSLHRGARFASVFEVGRLIGALAPQGILVRDAHDIRLFPALFALDGVLAVPPDWSFLTGDGRLIVDGTAINPFLIRKGRFPAIRPIGGDGCVLTLEMADSIDEPVLFVGGDVMGNYYHWLIDFFPRLVVFSRLKARLTAMGIRRIALLRDPPAFARTLLHGLGIREEEILWIDGARATPFRSLCVLSNLSQYGFVHPHGVEILRAAFQRKVSGTRKLYVSRRDAASRRIHNEAELAATLEAAGFETVVPSHLPFAEQHRLFAEASVIVGPHGAGLTNMLFAPPGAAVVELWPDVAPLRHFAVLARALGHGYGALRATAADTDRPRDHNAGFCIDPARVIEALNRN
ncbi:glycosyltransferase family 61 protein [Azospirillum soli]|uniref:glycosyltransferase family 61 protein n=1 Tax=Azospirillum soli TaxID=1304799 RepID=UPI001AE9FE9A|nr:glycosyltransferase family 61 protein [Azospirillum soli]MBP2316545.1 capsular polysaccharide biosynthesis protein [Azospirillum soli]